MSIRFFFSFFKLLLAFTGSHAQSKPEEEYWEMVDVGRDEWIANNLNAFERAKGYIPFAYTFHDMEERNLRIDFTDEDEMLISNISLVHGHSEGEIDGPSKYYFTDNYRIVMRSSCEYVIDTLLATDRQDFDETAFVEPYRYDVAVTSCTSVFPLLKKGDVISFKDNYLKLRVNNVIFDIQAFTDHDALTRNIWRVKQYYGATSDPEESPGSSEK